MISWVAINRIAEEKVPAGGPAVARPYRSDAEQLTDGELLAKLRSFGINLDRQSLERLCDKALSAEEIAGPLLKQRTFKSRSQELESDWIWICLLTLWERWFPHKLSFELLDDKMQAGYELLNSDNTVAGCRIWLDAWNDVTGILDRTGLKSIRAFDKRFRGSQALFNWIQDLESELWNAGQEDRQFLITRITVCEEGLRRFGGEDSLMTENWRRAVAESHHGLGETGKAEALYRDWLDADPRWGWGWIGWSGCYRFAHGDRKDLNRSEQILREGLAIAHVRDRSDLIERLADLCEEQGRGEEARQLRSQVKRREPTVDTAVQAGSAGTVLRHTNRLQIGEEGPRLGEFSNLTESPRSKPAQMPVRRPKAGRNAPCPCGSGKKFKKCCGA